MADRQPPAGPVPTVNVADSEAAYAAWEAEGRPLVTPGNDPDPDPA